MDERRWTKAQVLIEFSFCMVVIFLMIYAAMMIFRWTGSDLAARRVAHDDLLTTNVEQRYGNPATCFSYDTACEALMTCGCDGFGCYSCVGDPSCCQDWSTIADGPLKQIDPYFYRPGKMNAVWDGN